MELNSNNKFSPYLHQDGLPKNLIMVEGPAK